MKSAKYRIVELLSKESAKLVTTADIARALSIVYSHAHFFIKELEHEKVVILKKVGRSNIIFLNFIQPLATSYLSQISYLKTLEWQKKDSRSEKILKKIDDIRNKFLCAFLHGNKLIFIVETIKNDINCPFKCFRNKKIISWNEFNPKFYTNIIILAGAENYWKNGRNK